MKKEEVPIKNEGARVVITLKQFFRCSRAANSIITGGIWPKFELIQAFIVEHVTCKNEEDPFKNEECQLPSMTLQNIKETKIYINKSH